VRFSHEDEEKQNSKAGPSHGDIHRQCFPIRLDPSGSNAGQSPTGDLNRGVEEDTGIRP